MSYEEQERFSGILLKDLLECFFPARCHGGFHEKQN